jgi:hypothetical protein
MDERDTSTQQSGTDSPTDEEQPLPLDYAGEGETAEDEVDDASADSFPASDPPSFTRSTTD